MPLPSRRALLSGLGAAGAAALLTPAAAQAADTAVTTMAVYLRASASWSATRLAVVASGTRVTLTGATSGTWVQVTTGGQTGWIGSAYLTAVAPATTASYATTMDVWLRSAASWSAARLVVVRTGTRVTATGGVSGAWVEVLHEGRTGWIGSAYLTPVEGASTPAPSPAPGVVRPTTALWQTFSDGAGHSSIYHVWADGIDWSRTVGALWYLDGDYSVPAWSRVRNPTGAAMSAIAAEANRRNLVCLCLDTPDSSRDGVGWTWWYDRALTAPYFHAFATLKNAAHGFDPRRQWLMGYSGGAEMIARSLMAEKQGVWGFQGGGAIMVGGGGRPWTPDWSALPVGYKAMRASWVVGSQDVAGSTVPVTWSALDAARGGEAYYRAQGFTATSLTELPDTGHAYDLAGSMRAPLDAAGLPRLR